MIKNPPSNVGDMGSTPGPGTKIPCAKGQLSLQALEPRPHTRQKPLHFDEDSTCHNQDPTLPKINKQIF